MRLTHLLGVIALILIIAAILFPVSTGHLASPASRCLSNVKQLSLGLVMYEGDADDRFPLRDAWMDASKPYIKDESHFHCSEVPKGAYGYAFNGALSRAKATKIGDVATIPAIYDSLNPIRNASDLVASLPPEGRHGKAEMRGNFVGYADGHAKRVDIP